MHFALPEVIILGAGSQQDIAKKLIAEQQEMPVEDVWRVVQCPSCDTGSCHKACGIMRSFRYLGYKTTWERVEHISREVDNDSSGYISFQDSLQLVFADVSCYPARRLLI